MTERLSALSLWLVGVGVLGAVLVVALFARGIQPTNAAVPDRVYFQISTASVSASDFSVGELLAGILSHPPGISRCEPQYLCGPAGLIVSTRAADGAAASIIAVNSGATNSGLAQADVVAQAVTGQGPFAATGSAQQLRVIANLFSQSVHLIAATTSGIANVGDLRGKRVSLSPENSGSIVAARAVLQAYGVPEWRLSRNYDSPDIAADLLRRGELDAMFFVGGEPVDLVTRLVTEGVAVLIPLEGEGRERMIAAHPYLRVSVIAQGTYPGLPTIETLGVGTLWVTNASAPDRLVYGMVRAIYNPENRAAIERVTTGSDFLELDTAMTGATAPFHPGALQYYAEAGVFPAPVNPVIPKPKP